MAMNNELTPMRHLRRLQQNGVRSTLAREHEFILKQQHKVDAFLDNEPKNRYGHVLLYDENRVILDEQFDKSDYIHASWIDGLDRDNEYILCQAPFTTQTEFDVWRMVWQTRPTVIVLLTTGDFWPNTHKTKTYAEGRLLVRTDQMQISDQYDSYDITVRSAQLPALHLQLLHYSEWSNDENIPKSLCHFQKKVREVHEEIEKGRNGCKTYREDELPIYSPILMMCSTGVDRSGTLAALDICLQRLRRTRQEALEETVRILRQQRHGCVQSTDHFLFLAQSIVNQAIEEGIVDP